MALALAEQSMWQEAKAAFQRVGFEWTVHLPLLATTKSLDIFCHPFNSSMLPSSTPVWGPETVKASLGLRRIVSNTSSFDSMASSELSERSTSPDSSLSTSCFSELTFLSSLEVPVDLDILTPMDAPLPVAISEVPAFMFEQPILFSGPAPEPSIPPGGTVFPERDNPESNMAPSRLSGQVFFRAPTGKDREEPTDAFDPVAQAQDMEEKRQRRLGARERWLSAEVIKKGQGPSRIQDDSSSDPVQGEHVSVSEPGPVPREPTPLEYAFFTPFSVIIPSKDPLPFERPITFVDVISSVADAAAVEKDHITLEEASSPGRLIYDDYTLADWMVRELDNPWEESMLNLVL